MLIRRHHRGEVVKSTMVNILLTLPAIVGFLAVFALSISGKDGSLVAEPFTP